METSIPISKRSITGYGAILAILKLSGSTSEHTFEAMCFVTVLAVAYMIMDEIKGRRNGQVK